jgi:type IV pilus assembly protein PilF
MMWRPPLLAVPAVLLVLGGCASTTSTSQQGALLKSVANTTGTESDVRQRARIHTELAAGYFELSNMSVALEEIAVALRSDPTFVPAHNLAGLIYARLKQDRLAQQHFERAVRLDPLNSDANNNYGQYLCERKRESEAIGYFLAALRNPLYQHPDRSYVNAGLCSRRKGDLTAAEGYFRKALEIQPNQLQALYQLADIAHARGNAQDAKTHLSRLSMLATPNAETLWLALRVVRQLGDRDSEASYATQLRRHFPDSREARSLIAGHYE